MNAPLHILDLDPRTYDRALSCVHCGLCLPACPTYTQTHHEADSPRGRIQLMRALADGAIDLTDSVRSHLELCLDCRSCETACPSGVIYHELIEEARERFGKCEHQTPQGRLMRWIFFNIFPYPTRLKAMLLPVRVMQKLGVYGLIRRSGMLNILPEQLRKMEQMLPEEGDVWPKRLGGTGFQPVRRDRLEACPTKRVGVFTGCIGSVMYDKVNRQAAELLAACGAEVVVPGAQQCCGAIHHHNGAWEPARQMARRNIDAFVPENGPGVDAITTTIAGCGAMLHEYDHLLRDDPRYAKRAVEFCRRVKDISQVLLELGLPPMKHAFAQTVTYHDACHLVHAQKVSAAPRKLLAQVPGLKLVALPESDICCGAAGTYNLTQPKMAGELAARKLANIAATGATVCVMGNVGCAMHLRSAAAGAGQKLTILHPVEVLHGAVFG